MWWLFILLCGSMLSVFASVKYFASRHDVGKAMFYALLNIAGIVIMLAGAAAGLYLQR